MPNTGRYGTSLRLIVRASTSLVASSSCRRGILPDALPGLRRAFTSCNNVARADYEREKAPPGAQWGCRWLWPGDRDDHTLSTSMARAMISPTSPTILPLPAHSPGVIKYSTRRRKSPPALVRGAHDKRLNPAFQWAFGTKMKPDLVRDTVIDLMRKANTELPKT